MNPMQTGTHKKTFDAFAARLNEVCADMALPEHGRQSQLARLLGVTQGSTRKWLTGIGYPEMEKIVHICEWSGVNVNWLVMGVGPKRPGLIDTKTAILGEAIEAMPSNERQQVLDFLAYKFERSAEFFASDRLARYMKMIDAFKQHRSGLK
jgi:transcriptional regulator with XRE-family HTH domain